MSGTLLRDLMTLTKMRLSLLVLATTAVGYVLGAESVGGGVDWTLLAAIVGTAGAAFAASIINQVLERDLDRRMDRTAERPLPMGRLSRQTAVTLAVALGTTGLVVLLLAVNTLAAFLAGLSLATYVLIYTPLKTRSTLNTLVGAVCGALPPMIGWAAATGGLEPGAWALGGLLFVWQIPHFLALAWLYRDDYAKGSFAMLPVRDASGRLTAQIVVLTSLMLLPLALSVVLLGLAGFVYAAGSLAVGLWLAWAGIENYRLRTRRSARRVFLTSIAYLAAVMALLVIDQGAVLPSATTISPAAFTVPGLTP